MRQFRQFFLNNRQFVRGFGEKTRAPGDPWRSVGVRGSPWGSVALRKTPFIKLRVLVCMPSGGLPRGIDDLRFIFVFEVSATKAFFKKYA